MWECFAEQGSKTKIPTSFEAEKMGTHFCVKLFC